MIVIRLREAKRAYRQRTGERLTYQQLAARTGLGLSTLQAMASPRAYNATLRTIDTLCQALQCTPAELLDVQRDAEETVQAESSTEKPLLSTDNLAPLGEAIHLRRKALGLSQKALAQQTRLSVVYLRSVERGQRNLSLLAFLRIAKALQLTPAALLASLTPSLAVGHIF